MTRIKVAISKDNAVFTEEIKIEKNFEDVSISDFKNLITCGGTICGFYKVTE